MKSILKNFEVWLIAEDKHFSRSFVLIIMCVFLYLYLGTNNKIGDVIWKTFAYGFGAFVSYVIIYVVSDIFQHTKDLTERDTVKWSIDTNILKELDHIRYKRNLIRTNEIVEIALKEYIYSSPEYKDQAEKFKQYCNHLRDQGILK